MRYCSNCGNQFSGNEKFCTKCGAPAEVISSGAAKPAKKYSRTHKLRNVIIACISVLAVCGGGALAANYAVNEVFVSSDRELKKIAAAKDEIKSLSYDSSMEIDFDMIDGEDRENLTASIDIDGALSVEDKMAYSNIGITVNGETEEIQIYSEYDDNNIDLYTYESALDYWEKSSINPDSINQSLGDSSDYSWLTENIIRTNGIDKTEIDGTKAFVIDMSVDISELKNNIEQKFTDTWASMLGDYADAMGIMSDELSSLFGSTKPIDVKLYIDRKTDLPIRFEIDVKDSLNSLMGNISDLAGKYGEDDIGLEIKKSNLVIDFKDYNNSHVSIPAEAYDGYDNGIINEEI